MLVECLHRKNMSDAMIKWSTICSDTYVGRWNWIKMVPPQTRVCDKKCQVKIIWDFNIQTEHIIEVTMSLLLTKKKKNWEKKCLLVNVLFLVTIISRPQKLKSLNRTSTSGLRLTECGTFRPLLSPSTPQLSLECWWLYQWMIYIKKIIIKPSIPSLEKSALLHSVNILLYDLIENTHNARSMTKNKKDMQKKS